MLMLVLCESAILLINHPIGLKEDGCTDFKILGKQFSYFNNPTSIYLFKFNNGNIRTVSEIRCKLTIKAPEQCQ